MRFFQMPFVKLEMATNDEKLCLPIVKAFPRVFLGNDH